MGKEAKFVVRLDSAERRELQSMVDEGRGSKEVRKRARVLLKADRSEEGPGWVDERTAEFAEVSLSTVHRVRQRFVEEGFEAAVFRKPASDRQYRKLDGEGEARLIAVACSEAPAGRSRWTLQLLSDQLVALGVVESISHECVRTTRKKRAQAAFEAAMDDSAQAKQWQNSDFVAAMEDVLEVYRRPYDAHRPVVCLDEQSKQLVKQVNEPLPMRPGSQAKEDYEYERNGTANLFMLFEPLRGWRHVKVTDRRTKIDFAHVVRELVNVHYPNAEKIVLVMDNLNTHKLASLYDAFDPAEARRLIERLEIHYTPKHGSWLNMAETELSILTKQCLDRRIPDQPNPPPRSERLGTATQRRPMPNRLAIHHQGCEDQTEKLYPSIQL